MEEKPYIPCDNCGEPVEEIRLIKWRENGQVIRWWVCLPCWKKVFRNEYNHTPISKQYTASDCHIRN